MATDSTVQRISDKNYERIASHGKFGETFDEVLTRILDEYEKKIKK